jgi:prevent-host-death family protein
MRISIKEFESDPDKYIEMAQETDVLITKNGKLVAKLVAAKSEEIEAVKK